MALQNHLQTTSPARLIFVGAHPDDPELGAGATMRAFTKLGHEVVYVSLTKGECSGVAETRVQESIAACRVLGLKAENVFFGSFPDTRIPDNHDTIAFLESYCDGGVYAAFVPSTNERHQDHRHLAQCCRTAFRNVPRILAYESPSTTATFAPNAFVDIGEHLHAKRSALRCHRSQIRQCKMYMEYRSMIRLAAFRGQQAGVKYAEAFETIKFLVEPSATIVK